MHTVQCLAMLNRLNFGADSRHRVYANLLHLSPLHLHRTGLQYLRPGQSTPLEIKPIWILTVKLFWLRLPVHPKTKRLERRRSLHWLDEVLEKKPGLPTGNWQYPNKHVSAVHVGSQSYR